jgi:hypothetical protein
VTRPAGRSAGRVVGGHRVGLRVAAAAGVTALGVSSWLALQPGEFAAADTGVLPASGAGAGVRPGAGAPTVSPDGSGAPVGLAGPGGAAASPAPAGPGAAPPADAPPAPAPAPAAPVAPVVPVGLDVSGRDRVVDVVPVGVEPTGALVVPDDPDVLGWWQSGPGAGAGAGSTVLVGHLDVPGDLGVMRALAELPVDSTVTLRGAAGEASPYRVVARRTFAKNDGLPTDLFRTDGPPQLVLVTCGGEFDARTGHYADNVVVYAVPA